MNRDQEAIAFNIKKVNARIDQLEEEISKLRIESTNSHRRPMCSADHALEFVKKTCADGDSISPSALATAAGISYSSAARHLTMLAQSGRVTRVNRGRYAPASKSSLLKAAKNSKKREWSSVRDEGVSAAVSRFFSATGAAHTVNYVAASLPDHKPSSVKGAIYYLAACGRIKRIGNGLYRSA